jgi:hypothetical protein
VKAHLSYLLWCGERSVFEHALVQEAGRTSVMSITADILAVFVMSIFTPDARAQQCAESQRPSDFK